MLKNTNETIFFGGGVSVISSAAVGGKTEGEGPMKNEFDVLYTDDYIGCDTWEKAESALQLKAVETALEKAQLSCSEIDLIFAGDLLNQCTASSFGNAELHIPFLGMYGACSTMALTLATASVFIASKSCSRAIAATSSHFCSAEKQFRFPLEYGAQRCPTCQRTATAAGAFILSGSEENNIKIKSATIGKITDFGITDANNMGAAMAPAAADTIITHLKNTATVPNDYDMILTGDLGFIGSTLLNEMCVSDYNLNISSVHEDCGKLIFDREGQDVHAGGSGCGCSASVLASYIMRKMKMGEIKRLLFVATGALLSPTTTNQNMTIPCIAHAVEFSS